MDTSGVGGAKKRCIQDLHTSTDRWATVWKKKVNKEIKGSRYVSFPLSKDETKLLKNTTQRWSSCSLYRSGSVSHSISPTNCQFHCETTEHHLCNRLCLSSIPQAWSVNSLCDMLLHPRRDRNKVVPGEGGIVTPALSDDEIKILEDRSIGRWRICVMSGNLSDEPMTIVNDHESQEYASRAIGDTERGTINTPSKRGSGSE